MRKSEKRILISCVIIAFIIIFITEFLVLDFFYKKYYKYEKGELIAKVGNTRIYHNEIKDRLDYLSKTENKEITLDTIDKELLKAVLYETYIEKLMEKEFYKKKFNKQEIDMLTNSYKRNLIKENYFKLYITNNINDKDLEEKYKSLIKDVKDREERKIYHILVKTEEEADRIFKSLIRNDNFEYLAEKYSIDKATAINGGSLGYLIKGEIESKDFANIAFILKKGEISKPFQTKLGWHIIKIDDIRKTEIKDFEEVKDIVKKLLEEDLINEFLIKKTQNVNIKLINGKEDFYERFLHIW